MPVAYQPVGTVDLPEDSPPAYEAALRAAGRWREPDTTNSRAPTPALETASAAVTAFIEEQPLVALAIAAGVGGAIGWLIKR